jgi:hypothetical protein
MHTHDKRQGCRRKGTTRHKPEKQGHSQAPKNAEADTMVAMCNFLILMHQLVLNQADVLEISRLTAAAV